MTILKSTHFTAVETIPMVPGNGAVAGGIPHLNTALVVVTTSNVSTDQLRVCDIPSNAIVSSITVETDAASGVFTFSMGVYTKPVAGTSIGTLTGPIDFFVSARALGAYRTPVTMPGQVSPNWNSSMAATPLWTALGLTKDPGGTFELVAQLTATVTVGGTLTFRTTYILD